MEALETYDIGRGWKLRRDNEMEPGEIILYRHGRRVYHFTEPPKARAEDMITIAQSMAAVYDTAWSAGWEECRQVILQAVESATESV